MIDPRLHQLASVIVNYSARVRPGDLVAITGEPICMPAVEALSEAVLKAGGHPSFHPKSARLHELILRHGNADQIAHVSPFERAYLEKCDVLIVLLCPTNTRYLSRLDPKKAAVNQSARREMMSMAIARGSRGELRYCLTEIPGEASAQDADMSLTDYADWVYRAGYLDQPDPVAIWRRLHDAQARVVEYLQARSTLRITAPPSDGSHGGRRHEGTDITLDVSGRTWINCAGHENFPDGEVFTGPRAADGVVNYTFPAVYRGCEVDGIRLKFRDGRVVEASAENNEAHLIAMLDQDAGARGVGELGIGTNYAIQECIRNTLFDEKIGGTFHIAVGAGFPETGHTNDSGLHWDMVSDLRAGGAMYADGELIQRDGRFLPADWPAPASK